MWVAWGTLKADRLNKIAKQDTIPKPASLDRMPANNMRHRNTYKHGEERTGLNEETRVQEQPWPRAAPI